MSGWQDLNEWIKRLFAEWIIYVDESVGIFRWGRTIMCVLFAHCVGLDIGFAYIPIFELVYTKSYYSILVTSFATFHWGKIIHKNPSSFAYGGYACE